MMWPHNNSTANKYSFHWCGRDAKIRDEIKTHVIREKTKTETPTLLARPRPRLKMGLSQDETQVLRTTSLTILIQETNARMGFII